MRAYTTKTLTRDGITYTAEFREAASGGYEATTSFTIEAAGQAIDVFKDAPRGWTENARDGWLCHKFPALSMLADEVYENGLEVHFEAERRVA
jgi:hypothetical protein